MGTEKQPQLDGHKHPGALGQILQDKEARGGGRKTSTTRNFQPLGNKTFQLWSLLSQFTGQKNPEPLTTILADKDFSRVVWGQTLGPERKKQGKGCFFELWAVRARQIPQLTP